MDRPAVSLRIVPVTFRQASDFVSKHHRHHRPPGGMKFAVGVAAANELVGVAMVGRPIARHLDDGATVEVTRTCTIDVHNANSMLYGAAWRAARALGYTRLVTYTQAGESGSSVRAAGLLRAAELPPRSGWHSAGRSRADHGVDHVARTRWEIRTGHHATSHEPCNASSLSADERGGPSCNTGVSAGTAGDRPQPSCCRSSTWNGTGPMSSTALSSCPQERGDADQGAHGALASALHELASAIREASQRTEPDPLKLLRAEHVAELLELPVRTVHDQAAAGAIPHRRFGKHYRFSREDVEAIEQQMARGSSERRPSIRAARRLGRGEADRGRGLAHDADEGRK
jgi:excisionase family DNA binding protein